MSTHCISITSLHLQGDFWCHKCGNMHYVCILKNNIFIRLVNVCGHDGNIMYDADAAYMKWRSSFMAMGTSQAGVSLSMFSQFFHIRANEMCQ